MITRRWDLGLQSDALRNVKNDFLRDCEYFVKRDVKLADFIQNGRQSCAILDIDLVDVMETHSLP